MVAGQIPINPEDLPIDVEPMDDSLVYTAILERAAIATKLDKRGGPFASLQFTIADGDYEGRTVMLNYLPLPIPLSEDMTKAEMIRTRDRGVMMGRFARAFHLRGPMPSVTELNDRGAIDEWHDWIAQFYGNVGRLTVRNQEFPEGTGRMRSGVLDFVI